MRTRSFMLGLATAVAAVSLGVLALPASAATTDSCYSSATVSAGVPDLFTGTLFGNPVTLNVPLIGTPDLFTGPSCSVQVDGAVGGYVAELSVGSVAGLVAGQMVVSNGLGQSSKVVCGPAYGSCQTSTLVYGSSGFADARCSVSGVVGALTSVTCSLRPM